jgi:hypothetical protein
MSLTKATSIKWQSHIEGYPRLFGLRFFNKYLWDEKVGWELSLGVGLGVVRLVHRV